MASLIYDSGSNGTASRRSSTSVLHAAVSELVRLTAEIERGVQEADYMAALAAVAGLQPVEQHIGGQLTMRMMAADDQEDGPNEEHAGGVYL